MSEDTLVSAAHNLLSETYWEIGIAAENWVDRYAKGRDLVELARQLGLQGPTLAKMRMVAHRFGDVRGRHERLRWPHYLAALEWDDVDATLCLDWADENDATPAEMRAWHRAHNGARI